MGRRTRNRQAQWDAHRRNQTKRTDMEGLGSYAGGKKPQLVTGSVSGTPRKPTVTQRKGIHLKPFSDFVPGRPGDWTTAQGRDVSTRGGAILKPSHLNVKVTYDEDGNRTDQAPDPDREVLAFERNRLAERPSHEVALMATDRPSGMTSAKTYDERHEDDSKAGLYRDGLGRIMRTTDMEEVAEPILDLTGKSSDQPKQLSCRIDPLTQRVIVFEVDSEERLTGTVMSTTDYAQMHGVPTQRNSVQKRHAKAKEKAAREAERVAKREAREQDRAQRKLDRSSGKSGAGHVSRREMDEAARAVLRSHGVTSPTKQQMKAARDVIAHQQQVQAYTGGKA